jgi:hypothetical protein
MSVEHTNPRKAWDIVSDIIELHKKHLKAMTFIYYRPIPGILDRLGSETDPEVRAIFEEASSIRDNANDGRHFFDMAVSLAVSKGVGQQVITEMLKEPDPATRKRITIDIDGTALKELLQREANVRSREDVFAVASKCVLRDGTEAHIPMMDFRLKPLDGLQSIVTAMKSITSGGGTVLQTKNSYHFYGMGLLDSRGWLEFLGRCILFQGIIDDRYIGHRLHEGFCVLRLTRGPLHDEPPFVEANW